MAEDVRQIMAKLGYKTMEELVGRSDLLRIIDTDFARKFDFSNILHREEGVNTCQEASNKPFDDNAFEIDVLAEAMDAIKNSERPVRITRDICNLNRSFGARVSGEIAQYYGDKGLTKSRK